MKMISRSLVRVFRSNEVRHAWQMITRCVYVCVSEARTV